VQQCNCSHGLQHDFENVVVGVLLVFLVLPYCRFVLCETALQQTGRASSSKNITENGAVAHSPITQLHVSSNSSCYSRPGSSGSWGRARSPAPKSSSSKQCNSKMIPEAAARAQLGLHMNKRTDALELKKPHDANAARAQLMTSRLARSTHIVVARSSAGADAPRQQRCLLLHLPQRLAQRC
jgi:hypothetical protein